MRSSLHKNATTTPAIRQAIRDAEGTVNKLAVRFGQSRDTIMKWRRDYNAVRPHSCLGYRTPNEYKAPLSSNHQPEPGFQESVVR